MNINRCGNCDHPISRHADFDQELCRADNCACPGFLTVAKQAMTPMQVENERLRDAIRYTAIPTIAVFAPTNGGAQAALDILRALLKDGEK